MSGALEGIRIVDFGQYIAGPLAGMLLADQGADVIKVDPPGGARWDTPANAMWNRGKRSISLDLKRSDDLEIAKRLVAAADVIIENFRPGVMQRLGLDATALTRQHPHLVWCALPGFASDDPRATMPAWEGVLGAATGNFTLKVQAIRDDAGRRLPQPPDDRPIYSVIPVSSVYGACFAALSIAMALVARQRDGRGQQIEVPLYDATFCAIGAPRWAGIPGNPWYRSYECADGRWVDMVGYHAKFIRAFLKEAAVEHWLQEPFVGNINRPFRTEPKQATRLLQKMEALFRTRPALEWETRMAAAGVPLAMCRTTAEWLALPEARASGAIVELHDPRLGPTLQAGPQVRLSETPGTIRAAAPRLDQHRIEILGELDALAPRMLPLAAEPDSRPPLAGVRVADLGTVLVGPACGRTLAEFGADVIKIDDPMGFGPGIDVGRGKRSMLLDLRTAAGREVLDRLADSCDVFLQNFRFGIAEKMGIGYERLRARNPGLVYISYTLYGRQGPWAGRPGYENQAQAASGMMERFGDGRPAMEPLPVNDYGTALTGSFGVALALYHRNKATAHGAVARGQHVDAALVYTASMLQSPVLCSYPGKVWDERRGQSALGSGPLHRNYRAADGWFFLAAREWQVAELEKVEGLLGISRQELETLEPFLEARLRAAGVAEWSRRLAAVDVGVHRTLRIPEVMAEPYARLKNLYLERPHPDGGSVATIGPIPRLSQTPLQAGRPLRPSLDAKDILSELGYGDKIDRLTADGVVVIRPPKN
jgi:crotonobetainyl-CoA:carnitine CoA-transferase CaiB-like acyl-CoA transferase